MKKLTFKKSGKKFYYSPTPWSVHAYGDIGVDILDAEGTTIAHMTGKAGCAMGDNFLNGSLFGNAHLIVDLINKR